LWRLIETIGRNIHGAWEKLQQKGENNSGDSPYRRTGEGAEKPLPEPFPPNSKRLLTFALENLNDSEIMILPKGYCLQNGKYCLIEVIGQGGFGITYSGVWNTEVKGELGAVKTAVPICIKEYFFKDYCFRDPATMQVRVHSETGRRLFDKFREEMPEDYVRVTIERVASSAEEAGSEEAANRRRLCFSLVGVQLKEFFEEMRDVVDSGD